MEDMELNPHPDFLKGFNEGYMMTQFQPQLAEKIAKVIGDSERSEGFLQGRNQYVYEKDKADYPKWLQEDRWKDIDKNFDRDDRERDNREPEKDR